MSKQKCSANNLKIKLESELKETLKIEKQTYSDGDKQDDVILGWIEGLEYALSQLNFIANQSKGETK